ncbi:MAG: sugar phosphate nucleotidyltransferase [Candidatus Margulisiibacteriota bacterium]|jgi:dTDP-glucose pyrophosphorylase
MNELAIKNTISISEALKKINKTGMKILFVVDDNYILLGTLSDGDIRRSLLKNIDMKQSVYSIYNRVPITVTKGNYSMSDVRSLMLDKKIELVPVIDIKNKLIDYIVWTQAFDKQDPKIVKEKINIPVVIMAGGKGTRLEPFTKILPKPLIPIHQKTVLEVIIDEFRSYGIKNYFLTLNYKGEMIKAYFKSIEKDYKLNFIWEKDFYGTAGSLKLIENKISENFIVSNCDIIVKTDYKELVDFHINNKAALTIVSSVQHHTIPYGVVNYKDGGIVNGIIEKPEYILTINTGIYILNKNVLKFIPEKTFFDMPTLIKVLIENKYPVYTYPVNENDYMDIGQWEEYKNVVSKLTSFT